ncbi:MAG TPA: ATP-binding protein [Thermoanaerobaculia bacterium]
MQASDLSLFDALLQSSIDNIYVIDRQGRYAHVSRGGAEAIGRTPEQVVGKTWRDLGLPADLMTDVEEQWSRVFLTGETIHHEVTYEGRVYEYSMFALNDRVAVVSRDVTMRENTEEALHRAAERYRNFVANSSEGIWRFEADDPIDTSAPEDEQIRLMFERSHLAECNDAMARMYGYEQAGDIIGTRLARMLDPDEPENREHLRAFIRGGYRLTDAESIETDREGRRKYFLNSLHGVVENGKLLRAWGTQRDLTEQKLAIENVRQSEERLQALVAATTQIVLTSDPTGRVQWISPAWTEATGHSTDSVMEGGWSELLHPDDRGETVRRWERAHAARTMFDATARVRMHDGGYRWFRIRSAPVLNRDGTLREWVGALVDVDSERRQAELLAAQRRRAEFIADANDLFVRSLDYEETLRNLARMAVPRLADWCAVDMIEPDGRFRRLAVEHPDPEMLKLAFDMQEKYPSDPGSPTGLHAIARSGKTQWMAEIPDDLITKAARSPEHLAMIRKLRLRSYVAAPIFVRDHVAGVLTLVSSSRTFTEADVSLIEDLALRAGHAIENARLYENAIEANRAKDEFLATLSHELRTPLTAILGWANLLRMSNYDPQTTRTAVETIEQSAHAQAALIDDLLDISRIITGKLQIQIDAMDLVTVVENGIAAVRPAAKAKNIDINFDAPKTLMTRGDANRIQQIVWNLMSNAVKFSDERSHIDVRVASEDHHVVIRVTDQGIGIDPELLPHVFERFWQADSSSHRAHGGLGLGLAIVRYLAELHGGTVSAESAGRGRGTTFTVRLPAGAIDTSDVEPPRRARGIRVLLVEDDKATREVIGRTLEHFGANVTTAAKARDAAEIAGGDGFDLVLTDIAMPGEDGYWLLRELRKANPRLRIAALTALGQSDEQLAGAGFDAVLRKPVDPGRLAEILDRFSI